MLNKINNCFFFSTILSILFMLVGLMCIVVPSISFEVLAGIITGVFIVMGIVLILFDFYNKSVFINGFLYGIISFVIGIVLALHPVALKILLPIEIGIWFLVSGLLNLKFALYLKDESMVYMIIVIIMSLLSVGCGFVLIFRPLETINLLVVTLGITIFVQTSSNLVDIVILKKFMDKIIKKLKVSILEIEN